MGANCCKPPTTSVQSPRSKLKNKEVQGEAKYSKKQELASDVLQKECSETVVKNNITEDTIKLDTPIDIDKDNLHNFDDAADVGSHSVQKILDTMTAAPTHLGTVVYEIEENPQSVAKEMGQIHSYEHKEHDSVKGGRKRAKENEFGNNTNSDAHQSDHIGTNAVEKSCDNCVHRTRSRRQCSNKHRVYNSDATSSETANSKAKINAVSEEETPFQVTGSRGRKNTSRTMEACKMASLKDSDSASIKERSQSVKECVTLGTRHGSNRRRSSKRRHGLPNRNSGSSDRARLRENESLLISEEQGVQLHEQNSASGNCGKTRTQSSNKRRRGQQSQAYTGSTRRNNRMNESGSPSSDIIDSSDRCIKDSRESLKQHNLVGGSAVNYSDGFSDHSSHDIWLKRRMAISGNAGIKKSILPSSNTKATGQSTLDKKALCERGKSKSFKLLNSSKFTGTINEIAARGLKKDVKGLTYTDKSNSLSEMSNVLSPDNKSVACASSSNGRGKLKSVKSLKSSKSKSSFQSGNSTYYDAVTEKVDDSLCAPLQRNKSVSIDWRQKQKSEKDVQSPFGDPKTSMTSSDIQTGGKLTHFSIDIELSETARIEHPDAIHQAKNRKSWRPFRKITKPQPIMQSICPNYRLSLSEASCDDVSGVVSRPSHVGQKMESHVKEASQDLPKQPTQKTQPKSMLQRQSELRSRERKRNESNRIMNMTGCRLNERHMGILNLVEAGLMAGEIASCTRKRQYGLSKGL